MLKGDAAGLTLTVFVLFGLWLKTIVKKRENSL